MQVQSASVNAAAEGAKICLHKLEQAAQQLSSDAAHTGIGQDDKHYAELMAIVNKCVTALEAPQANLKQNIKTLETLHKIVLREENHSIT